MRTSLSAICALLVACGGGGKPGHDDLAMPVADLSAPDDLSAGGDLGSGGDLAVSPSPTPSPTPTPTPSPILVYDSTRALNGGDSTPTNQPVNLWVLNSDGSSIPLTQKSPSSVGQDSDSGVWSPDGTQVAFESVRDLNGNDAMNSNNTFNIWVMNADGSNQRPLTRMTAATAGCTGQAWSPDGKKLAFFSRRALDGSDAGGPVNNIWVMNSDGASPSPFTQLTTAGANSQFPVWSPDGTQIAYSSTRAINGSDAVNTNSIGNLWMISASLTADQAITIYTASGSGADHPAWFSDSKKIAYDSTGAINGTDASNPAKNVWILDVSSLPPTRTALTQSTDAAVVSQRPALSPVASRICYASTADPGGSGGANTTSNVFVMNGNGTSQTALTQLTSMFAAPGNCSWSRDGTRISFVSARAFNGGDATDSNLTNNLWLMNADGSSQAPWTQLANASVANPNWRR
jgi:Tol biopolymer transport system component